MKFTQLVRRSTLVGLVFAVAAVLAPGAAFAETITPVSPIPGLNILPSTVKGTAPPIASGAQQFLANMLYSFQKSPEFWTAQKAVDAGTATPTQTKIVVENGQKYLVPGTKLAPLVKAAGGVGAVLTAAQVGIAVGKFHTAIMGLDGNNLVCTSGASGVGQVLLEVGSGESCAGFMDYPEGFDPNVGITPGQTFSNLCDASARCAQFLGYKAYGTGTQFWCWTVTAAGSPSGFQVSRDGTWQPTPIHYDGIRVTECQKSFGGTANGGTGQYSTTQTFDGSRIPDGSGGYTESTRQDLPADPDRSYRCELISTTGTTVSAVSETFRETGTASAVPECGELPPGEVLGNTRIWEQTPGYPDELVQDSPTTDEFQHQATQYSECMGGGCRLDLINNATGLSCLDNPTPCLDWATDPDRDTSYTCRFGQQTADMQECLWYAPAFRPDTRLTGDTLADPATGTPLPNPGSGSNPGQDVAAFELPVADPDGSPRKCYPTGWAAFNPIEWVMKPVGCALDRAFVPRASKINEATVRLQNAWMVTTPAKIIQSVAAVAPALENLSDGACGGLHIDLSGIAPNIIPDASGNLLAACSGDFFHPWANGFKVFAYLSITLLGFVAVKAQISRFVSNGEA